MPVTVGVPEFGKTLMLLAPAREVILSWNAAVRTEIDVRVLFADGKLSPRLPYVRLDPWRSCSPEWGPLRIEVDTLKSTVPITALEIYSGDAQAVFAATPPEQVISPALRMWRRVAIPSALALPTKSQYIGEHRGWCSPASLAMLLGYWANWKGQPQWDRDVAQVAGEIEDPAYGGTGNWSFATAYAAILGLRGIVAYLPDLDAAQRILDVRIPLALAIAWEEDDLPGAPLPRSEGHMLVLRGFGYDGSVLVHDPAAPGIATGYPQAAFEQVWQAAGGVAYFVAPPSYDAVLFPLLQ